ncbi:MAG TPA: DNA polymerase III subunit delta' [Caulobacteraceae bacterium]|jgi:DNA polymerase-3 subunit delta'
MTGAFTHPRETFDFVGGEQAERAFADALSRGRVHHAWLLAGPEGVGKATFAYRVARRLLGATPSAVHGLMGSAPDDRVSRLVASRAHPDLLVLQRDPEDGKNRKQIPVEEARGLPEFFAKTPALAAWRVAIVDTADDLNASGANALLKILEEPPPCGIILLASATPAALLPTIRSRCRLLRIDPPQAAQITGWLSKRTGLPETESARFSDMAKGAPGRAWRFALSGATGADDAARSLIESLPKPDPAAVLAITDSFRGAEGAGRFALVIERIAEHVRTIAADKAMAGQGAERWAEAYDFVSSLPVQVEAVNLDRADAFHAALARLKQAAC